MLRLRKIVGFVSPDFGQRMPDVRYAASALSRMIGQTGHEYTVCGYEGRFKVVGHPPRYDARCPACRSLERRRLLILAFERLNLIEQGKRVLHFAPEPVLLKDQTP